MTDTNELVDPNLVERLRGEPENLADQLRAMAGLSDEARRMHRFDECLLAGADTILSLRSALDCLLSDSVVSDLNNIVRAFEDEGDRVYLGSTNDADRLREIAELFDEMRLKRAALNGEVWGGEKVMELRNPDGARLVEIGDTLLQRLIDAEEALAFIRDTFRRDIEQGYVTKDKTFAIEIADQALTPTQTGGSSHE